ncbi:efflux RND transporter permease subunit [Mariniblastus fucicola]|uniref:Efflux pump membrane transporter BepG n=1 Tax=Mariniblastus fucicola TaxID=980251 RepID=A0A5B9PK42_9BACT|nr:efflux RND transporter permease subunit [Mariniblastus fucicola]QEG25046.1 Efflux pump membrane transporter BepG [Mariniblastus fucicola]
MSATNETGLLDSDGHEELPLLTRLVAVFLRGDIAILFTVVSLIIGGVALVLTPREEEPQIIVPMADVMIEAPGLSAEEVERQVTQPLEKLLYQIDGVEYVYSMSQSGSAVVTVRFYVGEDREDSLVKLYNKVDSNADQIPQSVSSWMVKPVEIDDVPIVIVTLWSDAIDQYGDHELHRIAQEMQNELQAIPDTNRVWVVGGRPREIRVELDTQRMASRQTSAIQISNALQVSNLHSRIGNFEQQNQSFVVESGTIFRDVGELENLVVQVVEDRPVYLKDVADIIDGPAEPVGYSWIGFGPAESDSGSLPQSDDADGLFPAVHIAVAKRKGSNAVSVAKKVEQRLEELSPAMLPHGVHHRITRDYGETANEKVNELVEGLVIAVITVVGLIGLTIGWRAALVVALAIPVCYSLTLAVNLGLGYTINRVTMFALILALGLLVDDPITDVENIARYFSMRVAPARRSVMLAIQEVRPALIMSTLAIIASFLPLSFITGMMGPYMGPMALNVPLTVTLSTVVAFLVTPWLAMVAMRFMLDGDHEEEFDPTRGFLYRLSDKFLRPTLKSPVLSAAALGVTLLLLVGAMFLPALRLVPLKMLPYDNKNEFQIVIDMPESSTLDQTDNAARDVAAFLSGVAEVRDYEILSGQPSPMDFNGMVRHYFLRNQPFQADIRVNLAAKEVRQHQSHEIVLRLRDRLTEIGDRWGAEVKVVEVPPGPPVMSTITAEVYGPAEGNYAELIRSAEIVRDRMAKEPGIVDVDLSSESDQVRWVFETDKPKAALSGVSTADINRTLQMALGGDRSAVMRNEYEVAPLPIVLRLPRYKRSAIDDLKEIYVQGRTGNLVQLGGLGLFVEQLEDKTIYRKNLKQVMYVYGEVAGRPPADAIMDMELDRSEMVGVSDKESRPTSERTWLSPGGGVEWNVADEYEVKWNGEGEWKITLDVFRDLGLAFAAALFAIFMLLMFQTGSRLLPIVIMLAIPLTLIGIMPGFWVLNLNRAELIGGYANPVFFTATAMIGMIALAGIVVRNSVVLVDFIHYGQAEGLSLEESIVRSVAVRTRPILLTAGTTLLGNWVITLDPVFSGLAWAVIFGILTSTLFTLIVIPVVYYLLYRGAEHGEATLTA